MTYESEPEREAARTRMKRRETEKIDSRRMVAETARSARILNVGFRLHARSRRSTAEAEVNAVVPLIDAAARSGRIRARCSPTDDA